MGGSVMRRVSLRNLAAHKLRLVLTVFSIMLGTSFVAGSMVFTASISNAFGNLFDNVAPGVSAEVTASSDTVGAGVDNSVVDELSSRKSELGIDKLVTDYGATVTVAGGNGKAISTGGAPSIGSAFIPPDRALSPESTKIEAGGRAPHGRGEIAINSSAAEKNGLKVGSKTKVIVGQGSTEPMDVTVVALLDQPGSSSGFVNVQFDEKVARELMTDGTYVGMVDMRAAPGVSPEQLRDRVAAIVDPERYDVRTGDQVRDDAKGQFTDFLNIFQGILLAFAAIGLVVGTFIIYNTFSMIVAQRNKELALLRAVGASRRQISRSVLFEAFVVGIVGGAIGLVIGIGLAALLKLLANSGTGLPEGPLTVTPAAVLAALFVGIVVTMVSAWVPAARAARVAPVEAMRASAAEDSTNLGRRTLVGVGVALVALGLIVGGATGVGVGPAVTVGVGAGLAIIAAVLGGPALSRPFVGGLGRVLGAPFGKVGGLARTNAVRNPRRTAATAFALTLGLLLVTIIGILGASFKGTADEAVDTGIGADFIISDTNQQPLPTSIVDAITGTDGVGSVVAFGLVQAKYDGKFMTGQAAIGTGLGDLMHLQMLDGASPEVPADGLLVTEKFAKDKNWRRGDTVTFSTLGGKEVQVKVAGIFKDTQLIQPWIMGADAYRALVPQSLRMTTFILAGPAPGVTPDALRERLDATTADFLTVQVQDPEEFKGTISTAIDQMLAVLYAMLGLALVIAILGIVNTLALSVVERRREIGTLRAIGMVRAQVRRSIYLESVLIAVFGAVLGVVLGSGIGWAFTKTLAKWGLGDPVLPWSLIGGTVLAAGVVGILAALWPAVRAARTTPLEAIADL
ncbi:putative ABC transport system permease protein [Gordonia amarae]|uniref:ABC3 transporter permease C-terminal domain-containing protein n=2 Tax=Gordonia amarae TaxID=36821 RepID=G7GND2_9ACTN|nr:putative ABC transport system permease protein [Gordonia amarae]GAB05107.1 hypothetical protein GOAMR_26_00810 [Gordonia amarae NBRC 15530]